MVDKTRRFRKTSGSFDWSKSGKIDLPKATYEQIEAIKNKKRKENKKTKLTLLMICTSLLIILVLILFALLT